MRQRTERQVISYLAFLGILLAFGIDASLPAFDELRSAFGLAPDSNRITLIITLYFLGMAVGQLVYGPFADRFGRIPVLQAGIMVYCVGAIGSIVAPNLGILLISRLVWGLGAAGPGVLRSAIARDLYAGDQMARVISYMMGVFMLGPVLAPIAGEGILAIGSWRWVFAAALLLAAVLGVWTHRFGETLAPENQRPLDIAATMAGFRLVFRTRVTLGYTAALTFAGGAFIVFLGSAQPIIDNIYRRGDRFALWFAVSSVVMAVSFLSVNHFIDRYGAHRVAVFSAAAAVLFSVALLVVALTNDGVPSFWWWLTLIGFTNAFNILLTPTCYAMGLEPMGQLAGTASAVMGFVSTAGGAALAAIVDASINDTVTPMAVGYVGYGSLALFFLGWARRGVTGDQLLTPSPAAVSRTQPS